MCGSVTSALFGSAAQGTQAATSGIFGTAGDFALGNTLQTIGTGVSIAGQLKAGQDQSDLSKKQAELRKRQGEFDLKRSADEARRLKGRQITTAAKSGVTRSGSVLEIMNEAAEIAEQEALEIEFGAGAGVSSALFEGKAAKQSSQIGAASTLLGSIGGRI